MWVSYAPNGLIAPANVDRKHDSDLRIRAVVKRLLDKTHSPPYRRDEGLRLSYNTFRGLALVFRVRLKHSRYHAADSDLERFGAHLLRSPKGI